MTRFEKELSGALGAYWKKEAQKELERIKADFLTGKITGKRAGSSRVPCRIPEKCQTCNGGGAHGDADSFWRGNHGGQCFDRRENRDLKKK